MLKDTEQGGYYEDGMARGERGHKPQQKEDPTQGQAIDKQAKKRGAEKDPSHRAIAEEQGAKTSLRQKQPGSRRTRPQSKSMAR